MNFFFKKKVAVLGLGKSGISTIKFLKKKGVILFGWDDDKVKRDKAKKNGVIINNLKKINPESFLFLVVSPGISAVGNNKHPIVKKAENAKLEIINDIELFFRFKPFSQYIGVTGTNGKSTTVSLLSHVFNKFKINNSLGGNIGTPVFDLKNPKNGFYILEISSFQLELMKRTKFNIAMLLNVTKDHLDRHSNYKRYISEKIKIFNNQGKYNSSILGIDDEVSKSLLKKIKKKSKSQIVTISGKNNVGNIYVKNNYLHINYISKNKKILKKINLLKFKNFLGSHNYQNIAAIYAVMLKLNLLNWKKIEDSIKSFVGLPHRLQKVRQINNTFYVNDSKATNLASTEKALSCYQNIYWILGGKAKEKNLRSLKNHFFRIKHVFLLGETKKIYAKFLKKYLSCTLTKDLKEAVRLAHNLVQKKISKNKKDYSVVLFSPACSSLDEWENFEQRGNAFIKLVKKI